MGRISVSFSSQSHEGNIFFVIGKVKAALGTNRKAQYDELYKKVTSSKSYEEALAHIRQVVDLVDLDGRA